MKIKIKIKKKLLAYPGWTKSLLGWVINYNPIESKKDKSRISTNPSKIEYCYL